MEARKIDERDFHDQLRDVGLAEGEAEDVEQRLAPRRYYSVTRQSAIQIENWLREHCRGKRVLDYCCGPPSRAWPP